VEDTRRRFSLHRDRPETWTERPAQFQRFTQSGAFDGLGPYFSAIADTLIGPDAWNVPQHFGVPLVTFPDRVWDVPHSLWHVDQPPHLSLGALPVVRTFVILAKLESRGGGTCYIEGSHRAVMDFAKEPRTQTPHSGEMKKLLAKEEPWLAALFARNVPDRERRFMLEGGEVRGVQVKVKEITGEPGDAFIMQPAMLHTVAPNARATPRLMVVQALARHDVFTELMA
jgi:hypothetical protein